MSAGSSLLVKPSDLTMSNHPEEDHRGKLHELSMCTHVHTLLHNNSRVRSTPRPSIPLESCQSYQLLIQLLYQKWFLSGLGQLIHSLLTSAHNCIIHWLASVSSALKWEWKCYFAPWWPSYVPNPSRADHFLLIGPPVKQWRAKLYGRQRGRPALWCLHCS